METIEITRGLEVLLNVVWGSVVVAFALLVISSATYVAVHLWKKKK